MKIIYLFCLLALTVLLTQCESAKPFNAWFWTSKQYPEPYFLYINDSLKGPLPYLPTAPNCNDEQIKEKTLYALLPSGRYRIAVKDSTGNVVYKGVWKLQLSEHNKSINIQEKNDPRQSGQHISSEGDQDCLIAELFY